MAIYMPEIAEVCGGKFVGHGRAHAGVIREGSYRRKRSSLLLHRRCFSEGAEIVRNMALSFRRFVRSTNSAAATGGSIVKMRRRNREYADAGNRAARRRNRVWPDEN